MDCRSLRCCAFVEGFLDAMNLPGRVATVSWQISSDSSTEMVVNYKYMLWKTTNTTSKRTVQSPGSISHPR